MKFKAQQFKLKLHPETQRAVEENHSQIEKHGYEYIFAVRVSGVQLSLLEEWYGRKEGPDLIELTIKEKTDQLKLLKESSGVKTLAGLNKFVKKLHKNIKKNMS